MKKGKWERLGMGLCLLVSVLFLPGTDPGHCALNCLERSDYMGFLDIKNHSYTYDIVVQINGKSSKGPYTINKLVPGGTQISSVNVQLYADTYRIYVFVRPTDPNQKSVLYKVYHMWVDGDGFSNYLDVYIPDNYIPGSN